MSFEQLCLSETFTQMSRGLLQKSFVITSFHFIMNSMNQSTRHRIEVVGHRGCKNLRPENTLAGFKYALDLGVDAVELDVHLTKDGHVIVYHDYALNPDITRDEGGAWLDYTSQPLHMMTLEELSPFRLGQIKPGSIYASRHPDVVNVEDQPIPILRDVFQLLKGYPDARLYIEIKTTPITPDISSDPAALTRAVINEINASGMKHRCAILAFDARVIKQASMADPDGILFFNHFKTDSKSPWYGGLDLKDFNQSASALAKALGAHYGSSHFEHLNASDVDEAHKLGLKVMAWTVNAPVDMQRQIDMGVDAIVTDRPDILLELVKEQQNMRHEESKNGENGY
jgi:glycerophosphoryl diester phosphodiesterase